MNTGIQPNSKIIQWEKDLAKKFKINSLGSSPKYKLNDLNLLPYSTCRAFAQSLNIPLPPEIGYPFTPFYEEFLKDRIIRILGFLNLIIDTIDGPKAKIWEIKNLNHLPQKLKTGDILLNQNNHYIYDGIKPILLNFELPNSFKFPKYPFGYWSNIRKIIPSFNIDLWIDLPLFQNQLINNLRGPFDIRLYTLDLENYPEILTEVDQEYIFRTYFIYNGGGYSFEILASNTEEAIQIILNSEGSIDYGRNGYFIIGNYQVIYEDLDEDIEENVKKDIDEEKALKNYLSFWKIPWKWIWSK